MSTRPGKPTRRPRRGKQQAPASKATAGPDFAFHEVLESHKAALKRWKGETAAETSDREAIATAITAFAEVLKKRGRRERRGPEYEAWVELGMMAWRTALFAGATPYEAALEIDAAMKRRAATKQATDNAKKRPSKRRGDDAVQVNEAIPDESASRRQLSDRSQQRYRHRAVADLKKLRDLADRYPEGREQLHRILDGEVSLSAVLPDRHLTALHPVPDLAPGRPISSAYRFLRRAEQAKKIVSAAVEALGDDSPYARAAAADWLIQGLLGPPLADAA